MEERRDGGTDAQKLEGGRVIDLNRNDPVENSAQGGNKKEGGLQGVKEVRKKKVSGCASAARDHHLKDEKRFQSRYGTGETWIKSRLSDKNNTPR